MNFRLNSAMGFFLFSAAVISSVSAQTTAFTYQGRLNANGQPANGSYDLVFSLYTSPSGGSAVAGPITNTATGVTNGLFTSTLDFGPGVFAGANYWLQIAAQTNGGGGFVALNPRQPITASPYAVYAPNAGAAASAGSVAAANIVGGINGSNLVAGSVGTAQLAAGAFAKPAVVPGANPVLPNTSYLATNTGLATLYLPNANVGDVVQITGEGAGGWTALGSNPVWLPGSAPTNQNWNSVAASADGAHLVAVIQGGGIYLSTNSGASWGVSSATNQQWQAVASSADGSHLVAVTTIGDIFVSSDAGAHWTHTFQQFAPYPCVASSSDGTHLVAGYPNQGIYLSINSGTNWTLTSAPANQSWQSVASSADGTRLVAAIYNGGIYSSTNSGTNWNLTGAPVTSWESVASSADGTHLVAAAIVGGVYVSSDSGATWTQTVLPTQVWQSVASSSDGTRLIAVHSNGGIYTSTNSGTVWTHAAAPAYYWYSVASSADGTHLVAVSPQGIYATLLPTLASGVQGTSASLEYLGNGQWQPLISAVTSPVPATNLTGTIPMSDLPANLVTNSETGVTLSGTFNGTFNGTVGGTLTGNAAGLTNLNASQVANVALLAGGNSFTGNQIIAGSVGIGTNSPDSPLTVNGYTHIAGNNQLQVDVAGGPGYFGNFQNGNLGSFGISKPGYAYLAFDASNGWSYFPSGNVGIGIGTPAYPLQVVNGSGPQLVAGMDATHGLQIYDWNPTNINVDPTTSSAGTALHFGRDHAFYTVTFESGKVGIGTTAPTSLLSVNGSADKVGGGSWSTFSDARLKDIGPNFTNGLSALERIQPVFYHYQTNNPLHLPSDPEYVGLIAQQVQQAVPEAVQTTPTGYLSVNNDPVIWTMLNAIKELKTRDEAQLREKDEQIKALNERLQKLEWLVKQKN